MGALDLSVVIVNYNTLAHLRRCLASLPAGAAGLRWEAIVVDNASREPGVERVADEVARVRVLRRERNGGFAAGANTGVAAARAGTVMLLNPDTVVRPGALAALLAYLHANSDVGVVGPRIENPDGSLQLSCRRFPTVWTGLFNRYSLLTRLLPRNRFSCAYLMTDWNHDATRDVDWLSGSAMMVPKHTFGRVGPLDDGYFFAMEDVDFCRRVHDAGLRVVYLPSAVVSHVIGGSSSTAPNRTMIARHRGMWRYYRTHLRHDLLGRTPAPGVRLALDGVAAAGIAVRCAMLLALMNAARLPRRAARRPSVSRAVRRAGP
jgi:GT2 family glycosyltransferase